MSRRFSVRLSLRAIADLKGVYEWLAETSKPSADGWLASMKAEVASLESFPERCPKAREGRLLRQPIRQLLVGRYRALFAVHDRAVEILHVRHGAMGDAQAEDLR